MQFRFLCRALGNRHTGAGVEVGLGHLQVVLPCNRPAVSQPRADNVIRVHLRELGLPGGAEIVKQLRPRLHPGPADNSLELCTQIRVSGAVSGDDVDHARLRFVKHRSEVRAELREEREDPTVAPLMVLGLWAADREPAPHAVFLIAPIDITPRQRQVLRRAAQAAEAAQSEDQTPLSIGAGIEHFLSIVAADKRHA